MPPQKALFITLDQDDTTLLGKTISSPTCKKIIDLLTEKSYTETDIANELAIPLSTAHYNIQLLKKAGIVKTDEYHYSPKGKEVQHYSLASKYIIISPKTTFGIREKLRAALPVLLLLVCAALVLAFQNSLLGQLPSNQLMAATPSPMMAKGAIADEAIIESTVTENYADSAVSSTDSPVLSKSIISPEDSVASPVDSNVSPVDSTDTSTGSTQIVMVGQVSENQNSNLNWLYLLLGGIFALIGILVAEWFRSTRSPPI